MSLMNYPFSVPARAAAAEHKGHAGRGASSLAELIGAYDLSSPRFIGAALILALWSDAGVLQQYVRQGAKAFPLTDVFMLLAVSLALTTISALVLRREKPLVRSAILIAALYTVVDYVIRHAFLFAQPLWDLAYEPRILIDVFVWAALWVIILSACMRVFHSWLGAAIGTALDNFVIYFVSEAIFVRGHDFSTVIPSGAAGWQDYFTQHGPALLVSTLLTGAAFAILLRFTSTTKQPAARVAAQWNPFGVPPMH